MNPALVVIDMQKRFISPGTGLHPDLGEAIEIINYVAGEFRAAGRPVIWIRDREDIAETDPAFGVLDALTVEDDDPTVSKEASNAFCEPGLDSALEASGSDFALFCGFRAEQCVLATARGAADREFGHALLRGAVLSPAADAAPFVERISPIMSYEVAVALVRPEG